MPTTGSDEEPTETGADAGGEAESRERNPDPGRSASGGTGRDTEPSPETVSPDALTCRLVTAIGEADALTLRVRPTDEGATEVTRVVHAGDDELATTATLDRPVTLACARVVVTDLPGPASDVRLVRPILRTCASEDVVATDARFVNDGDGFVREGRRGRPTPPESPPSYRLERLRGDGLVAGRLVPAVGRLRERAFGLRERVGDGHVEVHADELVVGLDTPAGNQTYRECRVENGALCAWLLGETERTNGTDRDERSYRVVPPFPITADGATATARDGELEIRVPRCPRADRADGDVPFDD